jgi:hypothetical protein
LEKHFLVVSSSEDAIRKLEKYIKVGFTEIVLTNSSPNRSEFINLLAERVIPNLNNS